MGFRRKFSMTHVTQWRIQDFPEGGANLGGEAPTNYLANFPRKLHENEEIFSQRGARGMQSPPPVRCTNATEKGKASASKI